jgi:hypothetical protein
LCLQSKDPRFHALPLTSQRVAAFSDTVNELVYDVLISKVRHCLSEVARLPIWSSVEEQGGLPLPSFSAYPQAYVTSVGEYLLTLPQQLEPLAEGISGNESGNDEAQFFATEWIFKVMDAVPLYYTPEPDYDLQETCSLINTKKIITRQSYICKLLEQKILGACLSQLNIAPGQYTGTPKTLNLSLAGTTFKGRRVYHFNRMQIPFFFPSVNWRM